MTNDFFNVYVQTIHAAFCRQRTNKKLCQVENQGRTFSVFVLNVASSRFVQDSLEVAQSE